MKKSFFSSLSFFILSLNVYATDTTSPDKIDWKKYGDVEYCRSFTKYHAMQVGNLSETAMNQAYKNCMCEKKGYKEFCQKSNNKKLPK